MLRVETEMVAQMTSLKAKGLGEASNYEIVKYKKKKVRST